MSYKKVVIILVFVVVLLIDTLHLHGVNAADDEDDEAEEDPLEVAEREARALAEASSFEDLESAKKKRADDAVAVGGGGTLANASTASNDITTTTTLAPSNDAAPLASSTPSPIDVGAEGKRAGRDEKEKAKENKKRIVFGSAMKTNRMRRKFPLQFCKLEKDNGSICPGVHRGNFMEQFYYCKTTKRCYAFSYNGCGGNANRFSSLWECINSCVLKSSVAAKKLETNQL